MESHGLCAIVVVVVVAVSVARSSESLLEQFGGRIVESSSASSKADYDVSPTDGDGMYDCLWR